MSRLEHQPDPNLEPEEVLDAQQESAARRLALPDHAAETTTDMAARLQQVEELLRNAPLLAVPIGFAERVIAAIKGQSRAGPDYRDGLGVILGLFLAALIAIPLLGTPAYLIGRAIISADYRSSLIEDLGNFLDRILLWLQGSSLEGVVLLPLAVVMVAGLALFSRYVLRFFKDVLKSGASEQ